jgi:carboxylesterase type B
MRSSPGSIHGIDLPYVFGNFLPMTLLGIPGPEYDELDRRTSDSIMSLWMSFAKTSVPTGPGLTGWPRFELGTAQYLALAADPSVAKSTVARCAVLQVDESYR